MIVYKVINLISGKIYIGQSSRSDKNYFGSGMLIKKAIQKYGIKNFKKEILEHCNSKEQLNEKEIYWVKKLSSKIPNGYNLTDGGEGLLNPSKEIREKRSITYRNNKKAMKQVAELGKSWKGILKTEDHKQKMRKPRTEATKQKMRKPKSEKHRQNMKGPLTKEHCENISKSKQGCIPWNKNLTKEIDKRVAENGKSVSEALKGHVPWNKGLKNNYRGLKNG